MPTSPAALQFKADALRFKFEGGIPTSAAAAALKFGFEAIPGVESVHFVEGDAIEVLADRDRVAMAVLWPCIVAAGFAMDQVTVSGDTLTDRPAETSDEPGDTQSATAAA